jgi:hypothetical protein
VPDDNGSVQYEIVSDLLARVERLEACRYEREHEQQRAGDERLRRLVVDLAAIDRSVRDYRRKLRGELPWSCFDLPPSLRDMDLEEAP